MEARRRNHLATAVEQVLGIECAAVEVGGVIGGVGITIAEDVLDGHVLEFEGGDEGMALDLQFLGADGIEVIVVTAVIRVAHQRGHLLVELAAEELIGEGRRGEAVVDAVLDLGDLKWRRHALVVGLVVGVVERQVVGGLEAQGDAVAVVVLAGEVGLLAWKIIVCPAVPLHVHAADFHRQHVGNFRQVDAAAVALVAVVADAGLEAAAQLTGGFYRGHVDRAAGAVAPEQGALGSAQHFDAFHVDNVEHRTDGLAHVDAVDVEAHLGVNQQGRLAAADAANGDRHVGVGRRLFLDVGVGGQAADIGDIEYAQVLDPLAGECGHRDGRFLQHGLPALGGNDHLFQGGGAILCLGGYRQGRRGQYGQGQRCVPCGLKAKRSVVLVVSAGHRFAPVIVICGVSEL